jgi:hypothetical protein
VIGLLLLLACRAPTPTTAAPTGPPPRPDLPVDADRPTLPGTDPGSAMSAEIERACAAAPPPPAR